jgi:hypothetical protein
MPRASDAATNAQQTADFPLAQHAARSTPASETLMKATNSPKSLATLAMVKMELAKALEFAKKHSLPQELNKTVLSQHLDNALKQPNPPGFSRHLASSLRNAFKLYW